MRTCNAGSSEWSGWYGANGWLERESSNVLERRESTKAQRLLRSEGETNMVSAAFGGGLVPVPFPTLYECPGTRMSPALFHSFACENGV